LVKDQKSPHPGSSWRVAGGVTRMRGRPDPRGAVRRGSDRHWPKAVASGEDARFVATLIGADGRRHLLARERKGQIHRDLV
jgi:hypothetical protein